MRTAGFKLDLCSFGVVVLVILPSVILGASISSSSNINQVSATTSGGGLVRNINNNDEGALTTPKTTPLPTTTTRSSSLSWAHSIRLQKRSTVQLCGHRLVEAVKSICRGDLFAGSNRTKRSVSDIPGLQLRRIRRSISEKCCKQACSLTDLVRYCGGNRGSSSSSSSKSSVP